MRQHTTTRERLIEEAARLFHINGYSDTSVAEVLKGAKANSGSLYYFFKSKEDLLLAVIAHYRDALWPTIVQPAFERESDPIERIFAILDGYREFLQATSCAQGCPVGNLAIEIGDTSPQARTEVAAVFDAWREWVRKCLEDAGERLPEEIDRGQLATLVLTIMEGGVMQARAYRSLAPFDASVAELRRYFGLLQSV